MSSTQISVTSERGTYQVLIGPGLTAQLPGLLKAAGVGRQRILVSNARVWRLQGRRLRGVLPSGTRPVLMRDGERAKTLTTVSAIYEACVARGLDRSASLIAFGGGVVGDVAGFAAATYLRGIPVVQVPTTLLAQVDSAIGGKVGVNLPSGKNLVGAFHAPALVVCDPDVLGTLPRREFRAGLYEVVKYGVIASRPLFDRVSHSLDAILNHDPSVLTEIVSACCRIKATVVMSDERESGPRRALNFGHTVGHALESITGYSRFRHGEAVGYGMLAAARLSVLRGTLTRDDEQAIGDVVRAMGSMPPVSDLSAADALEVIKHDKKVVDGRLHFVLAAGLGRTTIAGDVRASELARAMRAIGMRA